MRVKSPPCWRDQVGVRAVLAALLFGSVVACSPGAMAHADAKPDGQAVFEGQKCTKCHKDGGKHDLSAIGKKHTAEFMKAYLQQEKEQDGKKHKKKFEGTSAELEALVKWLASRK